MEDASTPLLTSVDPPPPQMGEEEEEAQLLKQVDPPSLDDSIEQSIGSMGLAQLIQAFIVSIAWIFDAQQTFINVFTDAQPSWTCAAGSTLCSSAPTPCSLSPGEWAWALPKEASVVSEWGLMCNGSLAAGLPASAFFAGCLVGGLLLSTMADSLLGRKNMLFASCLTMSLAGALTPLSPNVWVYSAFRFVSGVGRASIGSSALVLSTEIIGKKWRGQVGIANFCFFTFGFLSLPALAYSVGRSSWRALYIWTSVPAIFYSVSTLYLVYESPRWLFVRGRKEEALKTLKSIASMNGKSLKSSILEVFIEVESLGIDAYLALKTLAQKTWSFRRLTAIMTVAFGIGFVYYGMPLSAGNLSFNLYWSVTFNALAEVPSSIMAMFLVSRMNRRPAVFVFSLMTGVGSVLCVFLTGEKWKGLQMGMEVLSFCSACTALNLLLVFSLELFPTSVRNTALTMVRQAQVFGGVFSPMLVVAGRKNALLSFGVFGLVIVSCGLCVFYLPETRGRGYCDTMEEEEYKETTSSEAVLA